MSNIKFMGIILVMSITTICKGQNLMWEQSYGGKGSDWAYSIDQTKDGGCIVAGWVEREGYDASQVYDNPYGPDCWVIKLDAKGNLEWENNYGSKADDQARSIRQTKDGGYIMAGYSGEANKDVSDNYRLSDFWVVKIGPSGSIKWENNFGGTENETITSIRQTRDGGYITLGRTRSGDKDVAGNNGGRDIWVVKLNGGGSIEWEKNFGSSGRDSPGEIIQTYDGGYIIVARTGTADNDVSSIKGKDDCWVIRLNSAGKILWEKTYGGSDYDGGESITQTRDSGFIVASSANSSDKDVTNHYKSPIQFSTPDYWIFKIDQNGNIQWDKNFGGSLSDKPYSIIRTQADKYVITGVTTSKDKDVSNHYGNEDYFVVQINNKGKLEWKNTYGGSQDDVANEIVQTNDGNFVIGGHSGSDDHDISQTKGNQFFWITKLSKPCTPVTSSISPKVCEKYTSPGNDETYVKGGTYHDTLENATANGCDSIITINLTIQDVDSSVNKTGGTLEANTSGATYQWLDCNSNYAPVSGATSQSFSPSATGKYAVAVTQDGCTDTSQCYQIQSTGIATNTNGKGLDIYPNPATDQITIVQQGNLEPGTLELKTLTGRTIQSGKLEGRGEHTVDVSDVSAGVYLLQVKTDEAVRTKKVVVE